MEINTFKELNNEPGKIPVCKNIKELFGVTRGVFVVFFFVSEMATNNVQYEYKLYLFIYFWLDVKVKRFETLF